MPRTPGVCPPADTVNEAQLRTERSGWKNVRTRKNFEKLGKALQYMPPLINQLSGFSLLDCHPLVPASQATGCRAPVATAEKENARKPPTQFFRWYRAHWSLSWSLFSYFKSQVKPYFGQFLRFTTLSEGLMSSTFVNQIINTQSRRHRWAIVGLNHPQIL